MSELIVNTISGLNNLSVGNTTVNSTVNSTSFSTGNTSITGDTLSIGNTTVNSTVNSTSISIGSNNLTVGNSSYFVSNGNVGIGTSSPGETLEVNGNIKIARTGGYKPYTIAIDGDAIFFRDDTNTRYPFKINAGEYDNALVIGSTGNVGIGTPSPATTLQVNGSLSKSSGSFRIPHPLPELKDTHDLVHSFVESPTADNIYRGKIQLQNGQATVNIDTHSGMTEGTFAALNGNVQVFLQNDSGWDLVRGSVSDNILTIISQNQQSSDTISWLIIAERQDEHMLETGWTDEFGRPTLEPLKMPDPILPEQEEV